MRARGPACTSNLALERHDLILLDAGCPFGHSLVDVVNPERGRLSTSSTHSAYSSHTSWTRRPGMPNSVAGAGVNEDDDIPFFMRMASRTRLLSTSKSGTVRFSVYRGWRSCHSPAGSRRPSKVIAKALSAGFQRFIHLLLPRPVGSRLRTTR